MNPADRGKFRRAMKRRKCTRTATKERRCGSGQAGEATWKICARRCCGGRRISTITASASRKNAARIRKRSTARVIEGLIPVVDGFEQALASHREPEYENYRKGFELIYKQLVDNLAQAGRGAHRSAGDDVRSAPASGDGSRGNNRT